MFFLRGLGIAIVLAGVVLSGVFSTDALASSTKLSVTTYADLVRFTGEGKLEVQILSLSGQKIFSGSNESVLDWKTSQVANGVYLYTVKINGEQKLGKVAVMRGWGQIAPVINLPTIGQVATGPEHLSSGTTLVSCTFNFTSFDHCGNFTATSWMGAYFWNQSRFSDGFDVYKRGDNNSANNPADNELGYNSFYGWDGSAYGRGGYFIVRAAQPFTTSNHGSRFAIAVTPSGSVSSSEVLNINEFLNVGIGTNAPGAKLEVQGTSGDLLRLTNPSAPTGPNVFRVDSSGTVYADGSYNCGLSSGCFNAGTGADVAERIDTSDKLEPGDVVELDPDRSGYFRKSRSSMSRLVAGIVSTAPAVTLGNNFDSNKENWKDNRPLLALAGRVPVKVTAKYGAIKVGDLLVSSPIPGYAMKCPEARQCIGAIIGKAMEPLAEGVGKIEVQVMLR